jgi:hypothetical protein
MVQAETPILLLAFNRPDVTRRVFDAIAAQRPRQIFMAVDGPRIGNPIDAQRCTQVQQIIHRVDWPCEVHTRFQDQNLGCKRAIESGITWFFEHVEAGIVLEDDCLPSDGFFGFCQDLLQRYEQDERVMCVSGNHFCPNFDDANPEQANSEKAAASYYFTKYMHCWGWATWRRAWQNYCPDLTNCHGKSDTDVIQHYPTSAAETKYWRKRFARVRSRRINTWDYGWQHAIWKQSGLIAAPAVNLVDNIGFGDDATHTAGDSTDLLPAKKNWTVDSHPDSVSQHVAADRIEARHGYQFGKKSLWTAARLEIQRAWNKQSPVKRAA